MKTLKILFGLALLYGAGTEFVHAGVELRNFFTPGVIAGALTLIIGAACLFASATAPGGLKIKSGNFAGNFLVAIAAFCAIAYYKNLRYTPDPLMVTFGSHKVDIAPCMLGSRQMIPDQYKRKDFCTCIAEHLVNNEKIINEYSHDLERGRINEVVDAARERNLFDQDDMAECISANKGMIWTEQIEETMRRGIMLKFKEAGYDSIYDVNKLCDCMVTEFKKLPFSEISKSDFSTSEKKARIDSLCSKLSKIK